MRTIVHCDVCHKKFSAQRSTAKYCSEPCKQSAKYRRDCGFTDVSDTYHHILEIYGKLRELEAIVSDKEKGYNTALTTDFWIGNLRDTLTKIDMNVGVKINELDNIWYVCDYCGQRHFGRTDKCEFCGKSEWKRL